MQLETYISDLLYRYECVTIPEFGAFITHRISAKIQEQNHIFYPPKKALSFNEQIQQNDGLLARYIADVEKIPFEAALNKISKRVKVLKSYLIQGETLAFKNIGEVSLNAEGKLLFEPSYELNYLTDAFGLAEFTSPQVTREVYKKQAEDLEKVIPIGVTREKRKSKSFLKYASVAVIALTLGGLVASNYYVNSIETHNQLAQEEAYEELDNRIQEATFVIDNPLSAVTLNVSKQVGNYHIVAGAFRVKENSEKKVNQLKALGYNSRVLGVNKYGLHEVVYGSYETGKEALKAVREIRKVHNKDAWIKVNSEPTPKPKKAKLTTTEESISSKFDLNQARKNLIASNEFDFNESPNIIKIINNVKGVESGYYAILGAFSTTEKRDQFISFLTSSNVTNVSYFFNSNNGKYYLYNKKYSDLEVADNGLVAQTKLTDSIKVATVKIEN